jgi:MFS family permease
VSNPIHQTGRILRSELQQYSQNTRRFNTNTRLVMIFSSVGGLTFGIFQLLFNFYVLSLAGFSPADAGLFTSATNIAGLIMAFPAVWLASRISHKSILIATGVGSAIALLGMVLLPDRFWLIAFSMLAGVSQSVRQVMVAPFLMRNTTPAERQYVFSLNFGTVTLMSFVGNTLGGFIPGLLAPLAHVESTSTLAYQMTFTFIIVASVLAILPMLMIDDPNPEHSRSQEVPLGRLWAERGILTRVLSPQFVIGLGAGLMMPFMNVYYRTVFHKPDSAIGLLFGASSLAMGLVQIIAPPIALRLGKIKTVVATQALSVPFLILLGVAAWLTPATPSLLEFWFWVAAIAFLIRTALMNLSGPVYQTFILEIVQPELQTWASSLNGVSFTVGWAFSPYLSGWLINTYGGLGFVPIFFITATLYTIGIAMMWGFFRHTEQPQPATQG